MENNENSYFKWREYIISHFVELGRIIDGLGGDTLLQDSRLRRFELKDTKQTYRTINHWCKIGLIDDNRTNTQGWRKFSIVELAFISIISTLRNFGIPLKTIGIVKEKLFTVPITEDYTNPNRMNWIEYACIHSARILQFGNIFLILTKDNEVYVVPAFTLHDQSILDDLPFTYLLINLNKLLNRIMPRNFQLAGINILTINNKTLEILKATANSNVDKITINKKGNEIDSIESVYSSDKSKIHELIESVGYGEVSLTIKDGKVVHTKSVSRKKLKK